MKKISIILMVIVMGACSSGKKVTIVGYNDAIQKNDQALATPELRQDARFLVDAKSYSLLIDQLSEMAVEQAYSRAVQEYAQKIKKDHTLLNTQLQQLATNTKIALPQTMSQSHQQLLQDLKNASRRDFDRTFIRTTERIYEDNLDMYRDVATRGYNDEVRAFAARQLSLLKNNQQAADKLEDELI